MRKKVFILILVLTMLIIPVDVSAANVAPFTLLIYMNGSDLETDDGSASADLEEMMIVGSSSSLNIIVETGGTYDWQTRGIDNDRIQRWYIDEGDMYLERDLPNANMGDAKTLESFIKWGVSKFPADNYGLIMWNHGSGSVYGYGYDENYEGDTLLLPELQSALKDAYEETGVKFEIIGFDTCLMASIETASILSPYSDYLAASEEIEPSHGWDYVTILDYIDKNPYDSGRKIGNVIVNSYLDYSNYFETEDAITISIIDLDRIDSVEKALSNLSREMRIDILDGVNIASIIKARSRSESYGEEGEEYGSSDMVDLYDFADNLQSIYPTESRALKNAIDEAVIYNESGKLSSNASGLSVYFPLKDKSMFSTKASIYNTIDFSSQYKSLINQMTSILIEENNGVEFDSSLIQIDSGQLGEVTNDYFEIQVDPEDMDNILETYLVIGELINADNMEIKKLGVMPGIEFDRNNGLLRAYYVDGWETIGNQLAVMHLLQEEEIFSEYTIPVLYNGERVNIHVLYEGDNEGEIIGARRVTEGNVPDKDFIKIKPGDEITPIYEVQSNDGSRISYGKTFKVEGRLKLGWEYLPAGDYTYQFYIKDVFQNESYSNYVIVSYVNSDSAIEEYNNLNEFSVEMELTIGNTLVKLNSELIKLDVPPQIIDGRSMMPIRFVAENLGATVSWNDIMKIVIIENESSKIYIPIGSNIAFLNGNSIELDVPAQIVDNRTLMPVRFIAESLGATVEWDSVNKTVIINK